MTEQSPTEHLLKYGNLSDAEVYAIHRFLRGITIEFELLAFQIIDRYRKKHIVQGIDEKGT
jgi:hypothetical protein